jgi:Protein kinase domain
LLSGSCAILALVTVTPDIPGHRISGVIGRGGFATVYRGWQLAVGRDVAVKIDNRVLFSERDRRRFIREVTAAGRLSGHPHVVAIYDAGTLDDGRPYMVMELCPGGSLMDELRTNGVLNPARVLDIGIKIADALAAAHAAGVLHRDVKPENILLNGYGVVGLSDFGLASILDPGGGQSVTREALTPAYASPERFRGQEPTAAGDLYSLAATMYCLLSGHPPHFPGDGSEISVATLIWLHEQPVDDIPGVPGALMATLRRTLAADPGLRPPSAEALRDELLTLPASAATTGLDHGVLTLTMPRADPTADTPAVTRNAAAPRTTRQAESGGRRTDRAPRRRSRARFAAVAVASAVVIAAAALLVTRALSPGAQAAPLTTQQQDLKKRVDLSKYESSCGAAQSVSGAEATVSCQPKSPWSGVTVSASSFDVTGTAIPFDESEIPDESAGLNNYLTSIIPDSVPVNPGSNAGTCSPNATTQCPTIGFSGYWGGVVGRLYAYQESGTYYVVWTFDNDEYEADHNEDFVVVASSSNESSLISFWNQTPV